MQLFSIKFLTCSVRKLQNRQIRTGLRSQMSDYSVQSPEQMLTMCVPAKHVEALHVAFSGSVFNFYKFSISSCDNAASKHAKNSNLLQGFGTKIKHYDV